MLIILSPAKSLDFTSKYDHPSPTQPYFASDTKKLINDLKKFSPQDLADLMELSQNLAQLNYERFQNFAANPQAPAILAFNGDVYEGLAKEAYGPKEFNYAQNNILILSGLYGILRPLDLIKPHRLEMGTNFSQNNFLVKNLYEFWQKKVTTKINEYNHEILINLASNEYFKAIDLKLINKKIINIFFQEKKSAKYTTIAINSKKARGLMTNFAITHHLDSPNDLKKFSQENYKFNATLSNDNNWYFTR